MKHSLLTLASVLLCTSFVSGENKMGNADLHKKLTPLQYKVTQQDGTEPPFKNEYWDNKKPGIYVDIVSGEPLFSSQHKYTSGTGWPSFYQALEPENIVEHKDSSLWMTRIEIRSKNGNSHLGHVFNDGPPPTGLRYCMNSAAMRFIPLEEMESAGYGKYLALFKTHEEKIAAPTAKAIFAGGCFWCMEKPFEKLDGVSSVISGYIGGHQKNPNYTEVSAGVTGHAEAVEVTFDPTKVSYEKLLEVFWMQIDPTTPNRQFIDHGSQYRSGIFYRTAAQKKLAEASRDTLAQSGRYGKKEIVTEITPAGTFYPAEDYHQDYYKKNPLRYKFYRYNSGRDKYLESIWGKDGKKRFSPTGTKQF